MVDYRKIIGWVTAFLSLCMISFWSFWGINETFHEGWYHASLLMNILMTLVQYMSIALIFLIVSLIGMNYNKLGAWIFFGIGVISLFFFSSNAGRLLVFLPMILFALGFRFGKFRHKRIVGGVFIAVFLLITLYFGIPQLLRVEARFNDHDFSEKVIVGNDIELLWAGQGLGFPIEGTDWESARENCAQLVDGPWRLPTRDELVRSMTLGGKNAVGFIDASGIARYDVVPDKETPLWNPNSKVIYYWTKDIEGEKAYLVAYNGFILSRSKSSAAGYQGYRCVKD